MKKILDAHKNVKKPLTCHFVSIYLHFWFSKHNPFPSVCYQNQGITRVIKHKTATANTDIFSL